MVTTNDDDLTDAQLRVLDTIWKARRWQEIPERTADDAEALVREGRLQMAYKLVARAKREGTRRHFSNSGAG